MGADVSVPISSTTTVPSGAAGPQLAALKSVRIQLEQIANEGDARMAAFQAQLDRIEAKLAELERGATATQQAHTALERVLAEKRRSDLFLRLALTAGEEGDDTEASLRKEIVGLVDRTTARSVRRRGTHPE